MRSNLPPEVKCPLWVKHVTNHSLSPTHQVQYCPQTGAEQELGQLFGPITTWLASKLLWLADGEVYTQARSSLQL